MGSTSQVFSWFALASCLVSVGAMHCSPHYRLEVTQADFALDLLRESDANQDKPKATVMSPFSIAVALAMTYVGSESTTYEQMNKVLAGGVSMEQFNAYFQELFDEMSKSVDYKLNSANKLYIQEGFCLKKTYVNTIEEFYGGQLDRVDFSHSVAVANEINEWVKNETNGKITDLVSSDLISEMTRMLLVNAIYFQGDWNKKFDTQLTHKSPFHESEGSTRMVDMMEVRGMFRYIEDKDVVVVELPYKSKQVSMVVFLPSEKHGLADMQKVMTGKRMLQLVQKASLQPVQVKLPKFKMEDKFQLPTTLKELGIVDAFTASANFSGISDVPLLISDVVHQAFIDVNEKGTKAAAATAVMMNKMSLPLEPKGYIKFTADHPFMFAVMKGNTILFIGQYY